MFTIKPYQTYFITMKTMNWLLSYSYGLYWVQPFGNGDVFFGHGFHNPIVYLSLYIAIAMVYWFIIC